MPGKNLSDNTDLIKKEDIPKFSAKPTSKGPIIAAIIAMVILLVLFIGVGVYLFLHPDVAAVLRDISLILLALGTLVIALLAMVLIIALVYLALKLNDLVDLLQYKLMPLLDKANETASIANETVRTVHSRVNVVTEEAVKPVVGVVSTVAAAKAVTKSLFARNRRTRK